MKSVIPYLSFAGRTETAFNFYADALGGRVTTLMRLGEMMPSTPAERRQQILHAEFAAGDASLMATDCSPEPSPPSPPSPTPGITLTLQCDSVEEQDRVWARLADGGTIRQPLHETFYGGRLGSLVDRFGVSWMLNCMLEQKH